VLKWLVYAEFRFDDGDHYRAEWAQSKVQPAGRAPEIGPTL
jgi:hypothetical protein